MIRNIIDSLKQRSHISGRTIQVADKGLNCLGNILHALKAGDGYIFSKSVKTLPEVEKTWVLLKNDYVDVKNKKGEVLYHIKECVDDFAYTYTDDTGHTETLKLREKRIVTFNPKLAEKQKYEINRQVEKAKALRATVSLALFFHNLMTRMLRQTGVINLFYLLLLFQPPSYQKGILL